MWMVGHFLGSAHGFCNHHSEKRTNNQLTAQDHDDASGPDFSHAFVGFLYANLQTNAVLEGVGFRV